MFQRKGNCLTGAMVLLADGGLEFWKEPGAILGRIENKPELASI
jgi:hypothetical protein